MSDLQELFSRDPRELTKDNIDTIIAKMRESRAQFTLGNMKAGSMKPKAAPKTAAGKAAASLGLKLDLTSLVKK
jgi:hypothetical protein